MKQFFMLCPLSKLVKLLIFRNLMHSQDWREISHMLTILSIRELKKIKINTLLNLYQIAFNFLQARFEGI